VKKHPELSLKSYIQAPEEIPVELLFTKDILIIGIASTAIIQTNSYNIISLVHLVKWTDEVFKDRALLRLPKHVKKPTTIDELVALLASVNKDNILFQVILLINSTNFFV
jgi:hypothetical protein